MSYGRARQHKERRRLLRRRLETQGVPAHQIDAAVARLKAEQEAARRAGVPVGDLDAIHDETWRQPDDSRYKPNLGDSLERGAARVTARTAKAARRRKATTRWELDGQEAS